MQTCCFILVGAATNERERCCLSKIQMNQSWSLWFFYCNYSPNWAVNCKQTHSWHVCFWQKPIFSSSDLHCCSFLILQLFAVFVHGSQIFLTCRRLNVINSQCVRTVCACAHVRGPHCLPVPTVAPLIYHVWLLWVRYIKDKQENEGIYLECWAAYKYF